MRKPTFDLLEVRRQLVSLRSVHSDKPPVTRLVNRAIAKISHLHEPHSKTHEAELRKLVAKTILAVEESASGAAVPGRR